MSVKLKYALPLAQMAVAVWLLQWSHLWLRAAHRAGAGVIGPAPPFTLLESINAPVALFRYMNVPVPWDDEIFIATIGVFWYWLALNIQSWRERRTLLLFAWKPLRIAADLLLIAMGACLGLFCIFVMTGGLHPFGYATWPWLIPIWVSLFMWSLGSLFFLGRDLLHCAFRRSPRPLC